jgi:hypothetical protein
MEMDILTIIPVRGRDEAGALINLLMKMEMVLLMAKDSGSMKAFHGKMKHPAIGDRERAKAKDTTGEDKRAGNE